jgi:hypothetical protein
MTSERSVKLQSILSMSFRDATLRVPKGTRAGTWPALSFKRPEDGTVVTLIHLSACLPVATSQSLIVLS